MVHTHVARASMLVVSLALLSACSKEPASPPPSQTAPSAAAPAPAPAPAPSAATPPASPTASATGAEDEKDLAGKSGCLACHAVDKKVVGPAYKDVAAKYAGQPDAEAKLIQKVKNGGSGVWGSVPMPPNPQVSDENLKKLVHWILSLK